MSEVEADLWDCDRSGTGRRGLYVAVSGNTAAGKSSLITQVERELREIGVDAIGVSERYFHHPYLRMMFSAPDTFAFPVQLSFMVNRHLVLLRQLVDLGRVVVMERSHLDDPLFVEEHLATAAISDEQAEVYRAVDRTLAGSVPVPDVLVLMNPPPELSLRRLAAAEANGERPAEFPSEAAKTTWVNRWYDLYLDCHQRFRRENQPGGRLEHSTVVEADPAAPTAQNVALVLNAVRSRLGVPG